MKGTAIVLLDLLKSGSFALLQALVGFGIAYAVTGSAAVAAAIALIGCCAGSFAFLLHERIWKTMLR